VRLLLILPVIAAAGLLATATPTASTESISFTLFTPFGNESGIGGGICLGNRRVTDPRMYSGVRWSPNGSRFLFWRETGRLPSGMALADIFAANADGSGERNLTRGAGDFNWSADWSPDGARIVYAESGATVVQLVTMRADGSDKTRLAATTLTRSDLVAHPTWSPTGRIAYTRSRSSQLPEVWTIRPDGSDHRLLLENAYGPDWSPDGRRLVFVRRGDLFVAGADGRNQRQLTRDPDHADAEPQWAPSGARIAAISTDERDPKIYDTSDRLILVDADNGDVRTLPAPPGAWSPTWRAAATPVAGQRRCVVLGTRRRDVLVGTARGDLIYARGGNDVIRAGGGNDVVFCQAGSDRILAGPGNDVIGAQDNRADLVDGGRGRDAARVDRRRDTLRSIERRLP
jgi:Tol biopolymer transport system component